MVHLSYNVTICIEVTFCRGYGRGKRVFPLQGKIKAYPATIIRATPVVEISLWIGRRLSTHKRVQLTVSRSRKKIDRYASYQSRWVCGESLKLQPKISPPSAEPSTESCGGNMADGASHLCALRWKTAATVPVWHCGATPTTADAIDNASSSSGSGVFHIVRTGLHQKLSKRVCWRNDCNALK